jgi:hypothetical protein
MKLNEKGVALVMTVKAFKSILSTETVQLPEERAQRGDV